MGFRHNNMFCQQACQFLQTVIVRFGNNFEGEWDLRTLYKVIACVILYSTRSDPIPLMWVGSGHETNTYIDWYGHSIIL